jgi:hypothetical protein
MNRLAPRLRFRFNVASLEMHITACITPTDMYPTQRFEPTHPAKLTHRRQRRRRLISSVGPTEESDPSLTRLVLILDRRIGGTRTVLYSYRTDIASCALSLGTGR